MTVIERLADYVVSLHETQLGTNTLSAARRCLFDWYGATVAGGALPPATLMIEALTDNQSEGQVRLIPFAQRTDVRTAALINGTASHTPEMDDIYRHGIYHPGSPVIAATTALAEAHHLSGLELLKGIVAGYETSNRIARQINPAHYRYWHTTATVGYFGAAAAASYLLRLDKKETAHAIATTGTFAAGLKQAFRSDAMSKPLHAGRAAEGGVMAAMCAKAGLTGVLDIFEGEVGFGAAMCENVDWDTMTADLGEHFTIEQMTQKYHACCGHSFACIDAAIELAAENKLIPSEIADICVRTYAQGVEVCANANPVSPYDAKFSIPFVVAHALIHGRCGPTAFNQTRLQEPEIRTLMGKVRLQLCPDCEAVFPGQRAANVTVTMNNGRSFEQRRDTRKGDPDDPLSEEELTEKHRELTQPVMGTDRARELERALLQVEKLQDFAELPLAGQPERADAAE